MGTLKSVLKFFNESADSLNDIIKELEKFQEYFNENFLEINRYRNSEIEFLQKEFFKDKSQFPGEIEQLFDNELGNQEKLFGENLEKLKNQRKKLNDSFSEKDSERVKMVKKFKRSNVTLDNKEEKLKADILKLETKVDKYNKKIEEMSSGFGFIINFFKMRKLQKTKNEIFDIRDELIDKIELIREKWEKKEELYKKEILDVKSQWNDSQIDRSLVEEKYLNLEKNKKGIILKAAFSAILDSLSGDESFLKDVESEKVKACPKCKSNNNDNYFFCYYCGERFQKDRKDIMGSLVEVGECNQVFHSLENGIKETVSFLALMKGVKVGVDEFSKSVKSVKSSQDQYASLPKLKIDVPEFSKKFSANFKGVKSKLDFDKKNLHPLEFAKPLQEYSDKVFTSGNIEKFFEKMGDELNKTTEAQW